MVLPTVTRVFSRQWDVWNVRGAVLVSLCFQILLIFLAPLRKRSGMFSTNIIIWSAYLMADWIAVYAIGAIINNARNDCEESSLDYVQAALWAPFVLLHLGGTDSITAFSLEDNELWIRHLLRLIVELVMVAYLFYQSIPNAFWLPTVLVFVAGAIKYGERTRALYLACLGNLKDSMRSKPDAGPNYAQLMEDYSSMKEAQLPAEIVIAPEPQRMAGHAMEEQHIEITVLGNERPLQEKQRSRKNLLKEIQVVKEGYKLYKIFRGLIVDHMVSFHERSESRVLLPIETKRCFQSNGGRAEFHGLRILDIPITCALLVGAIILHFVSLIKILFSDWTIALLKHSKFLEVIYSIHKMTSHQARWSESISQHNLVSYCLKKRFVWLDSTIDHFGLKSTFEEICYKYNRHVNEGLKECIFNELKEKAEKAQGTRAAKEICSSRGEGAINDHGIRLQSVVLSVSKDVENDGSVLLWHIATDLLYFTLDAPDQDAAPSYLDTPCNPREIFKHCFTLNNPDQEEAKPDHRKICKILSGYMLYLLVMRPTLMSAVAGVSQIRFQDTCAEAMRFFRRGKSISEQREACGKLLSVSTEVKPIDKSLLFDACILSKDLRNINSDKMWEMTSKVWLELLCYGASHCKGNAHAQQLSKGGELITFVWLLMTHFGLGDQFRIEAGHARAKLIIDWQQEKQEQAEHEKDL
ncbi:hypothetical protein Pfo_022832 [Paulownia fortunei]|nr:hypothetical protein Pfo_022832 [Paulownia fortunei]